MSSPIRDFARECPVLIFDLGGVLVDLNLERCLLNFAALGFKDAARLISKTHQSGIFERFESGKISGAEFCREVREFAGIRAGDAEIRAAWVSMLGGLRPEKLKLLKRLKSQGRQKILLLSNVNEFAWDFCLKNYFERGGGSLCDFFDRAFLSFEMKLLKPDLRIYKNLLKEIGAPAGDCLFIDDSPSNCAAAESLGIRALRYEDEGEKYFEKTFLGRLFC